MRALHARARTLDARSAACAACRLQQSGVSTAEGVAGCQVPDNGRRGPQIGASGGLRITEGRAMRAAATHAGEGCARKTSSNGPPNHGHCLCLCPARRTRKAAQISAYRGDAVGDGLSATAGGFRRESEAAHTRCTFCIGVLSLLSPLLATATAPMLPTRRANSPCRYRAQLLRRSSQEQERRRRRLQKSRLCDKRPDSLVAKDRVFNV